jgi:hypothetical protein
MTISLNRLINFTTDIFQSELLKYFLIKLLKLIRYIYILTILGLMVSTVAFGNNCQLAGGVESGESCLCPPNNQPFDPSKDLCKSGFICDDGQLLENILENDGKVLSKYPEGTFTIRKVKGNPHTGMTIIVYLKNVSDDQSHPKQVRILITSLGMSLSSLAEQPKKDMDIVMEFAKNNGLNRPLLVSQFCNQNLALKPPLPQSDPAEAQACNEVHLQKLYEVEPLFFLQSEWKDYLDFQSKKEFLENNSEVSKLISPVLTEARIQNFLSRMGLHRRILHDSQFFHGSTSASLLAFTNYNQFQGKLIPTGILESQGKVPFSGEIAFGRRGINQNNISTAHLGRIEDAIQYANQQSWNPEIGLQSIKEAEDYPKELRINIVEITEARIREWEKLDPFEKALVSDGFPVLYGIKPRTHRKKDLSTVRSAVYGEVAISNEVNPDEIKVIYIPRDKIEGIKTLIQTKFPDIKIEPLELLKPEKK